VTFWFGPSLSFLRPSPSFHGPSLGPVQAYIVGHSLVSLTSLKISRGHCHGLRWRKKCHATLSATECFWTGISWFGVLTVCHSCMNLDPWALGFFSPFKTCASLPSQSLSTPCRHPKSHVRSYTSLSALLPQPQNQAVNICVRKGGVKIPCVRLASWFPSRVLLTSRTCSAFKLQDLLWFQDQFKTLSRERINSRNPRTPRWPVSPDPMIGRYKSFRRCSPSRSSGIRPITGPSRLPAASDDKDDDED
jgi:hypothetical protein